MRLRDLCLSASAEELPIQPLTVKARGSRRASRRLLQVFPVLLVLLAALAAQAQRYTKIVVFGDSLSDTGNDATLFVETYGFPFPSPFFLTNTGFTYTGLYTGGRFTDGWDTLPSAHRYFGVWVEQLAEALPAHPTVTPSLWGGTNYAYGYGNTFDGITFFNVTNTPFTITVNNVGQQISDYLATHPKIDDHTLFVVWGGANDLTEAALAGGSLNTIESAIANGAIAQVGNIQMLIDAGATQFLVPNVPNLGAVPRFNMTPYSPAFTGFSVLYNTVLNEGVSSLPAQNPLRHLTINQFDVFSLLNNIIANQASYGLSNVMGSSQNTAVNPDTFLFWDDLHPTTRGHNLLGQAALQVIEPHGCLVQVSNSPVEYLGSPAPGCR